MGNYKYESVYYGIKRSIIASFKEGDQLPIDQHYANDYGVSLITIKKAMKLLVKEGYVERKSGMRTRVISTDVEKKRYSLIIPDSSNAFGSEIVREFELWCLRNNYIPLISKTFENQIFENEVVKNHIKLKTCGIIIMPIYTEYYNPDLIEMTNRRLPMVSIDRSIKYLPISTVKSNAKKDTQKLLQSFSSKEDSDLLIISPPLDKQTPIYDRIKTLIEELETQKQTYKVIYTKACIDSLESTEKTSENQQLKEAILSTNLDSYRKIICLHHELACVTDEIINHLDKTEIICFDAPRQKVNRFTHIKQDEKSILNTAIELLLDTENSKIREINIDSELIFTNKNP